MFLGREFTAFSFLLFGGTNEVYRLPTRWAGQTIVVSESVLLDSPYGVENMRAPADKTQALNHLKRVVEAYWSKKKKGGSSTGASTPTGNGPAPQRAPVPAVPLGMRKGG